MDWNLYEAEVDLLKPGAVHLVAELTGLLFYDRAEALLAAVEPETTSTPVMIPSGMPTQAQGRTSEARIIADSSAWNAFYASVSQDSQASAVEPPIDLSTKSLVAVIADLKRDGPSPVVTHIERGDVEKVSVVLPELSTKDPTPANRPGAITLLEVTRLSENAQVEFKTLDSFRQ